MLEISVANCKAYLEAVGFLNARQLKRVSPLGGGVSNEVLKIETSEGNFVLKQALPRLRVRDEWLADVTRVHRERDAIRLAGELFQGSHVPRVVFSDQVNHVLIVTCAPESCVPWKQELLEGRVDLTIASKVGELLGTIHGRTHQDEVSKRLFASHEAFDQLRVDPYYRTTAARHPDLSGCFQAAIERALTVKECLVHGDYSPKNILIRPAPGKLETATEPILLDFEVVHYGDPTFDTGFLLNHLYIKSMYVPAEKPDFFRAAQSFWKSYLDLVRGCGWGDLEGRTFQHLGCLMLARIDGKSPVEYVQERLLKEGIRRVARTAIGDRLRTFAELEQVINEN